MVPKKNTDPLEYPPKASSNTEDSSSEEESESSSDEDNSNLPVKKLQPDDSSSDSDGEEPSKSPVEPRATKPIIAPKAVAAVSSSKKRDNGSSTEIESNKKAKKVPETAENSSKKLLLFQRVFSEEDEIAVLQGLDDYKTKLGKNPFVDSDGFYEYVKDRLKCDVNKSQLNDKVKRLKKKYTNQSIKNPNFTKPHDQKAYELSKNIWAGGESSMPKPPPAAAKKGASQKKSEKANGESGDQKMDVDGNNMVGLRRLDEMLRIADSSEESAFLKYGLEVADETTMAELQEEWSKLRIAQLGIFIERTKLTLEVAELALKAAKYATR